MADGLAPARPGAGGGARQGEAAGRGEGRDCHRGRGAAHRALRPCGAALSPCLATFLAHPTELLRGVHEVGVHVQQDEHRLAGRVHRRLGGGRRGGGGGRQHEQGAANKRPEGARRRRVALASDSATSTNPLAVPLTFFSFLGLDVKLSPSLGPPGPFCSNTSLTDSSLVAGGFSCGHVRSRAG